MTPPTHPRPQLRRPWVSLDGEWRFALDPDAHWARPAEVTFDRTIRMPFAPETFGQRGGRNRLLSGVLVRAPGEPAAAAEGERWVLHFGAVDYEATVWANGVPLATARGRVHPVSRRR